MVALVLVFKADDHVIVKMKITNKDNKKAREYAMGYYIENAKKKNPEFKLNKAWKTEIQRYINGIISAQEFNEWTKSN